jgi:hypothetical protein
MKLETLKKIARWIIILSLTLSNVVNGVIHIIKKGTNIKLENSTISWFVKVEFGFLVFSTNINYLLPSLFFLVPILFHYASYCFITQ